MEVIWYYVGLLLPKAFGKRPKGVFFSAAVTHCCPVVGSIGGAGAGWSASSKSTAAAAVLPVSWRMWSRDAPNIVRRKRCSASFAVSAEEYGLSESIELSVSKGCRNVVKLLLQCRVLVKNKPAVKKLQVHETYTGKRL